MRGQEADDDAGEEACRQALRAKGENEVRNDSDAKEYEKKFKEINKISPKRQSPNRKVKSARELRLCLPMEAALPTPLP